MRRINLITLSAFLGAFALLPATAQNEAPPATPRVFGYRDFAAQQKLEKEMIAQGKRIVRLRDGWVE